MPEQAVTPVEDLIPEQPTLDALREAAAGCRACDLWATASVLRARDDEARHEQMAAFVRDLQVAARLLPDAAESHRAASS